MVNEKNRSWEIVYTDFSGMERKTVELLEKDVGSYILRRKGVYTLYVLPCYKEGEKAIEKNAFVVGTYEESALVRAFVKKEEIPKDGYCLKVVSRPENPAYSLVIVTAHEQKNLYYAALAFLQDYIFENAPLHGAGLRMPDLIFDSPLVEKTYASAPKVKTRGIFAWGHPINDYKKFIEDMARQKLNQLIIWNDFVPLNAKDIADYAHGFGIELIWGFAWGWLAEGCDHVQDLSPAVLKKIKENVLKVFEENYKDLGLDGIYFQSFTETTREYVGDVLVAKAVTEFVNDVAGELLDRYPNLKIQFGLHGLSVVNRLDEIAKVDKRIEIVWEDCGEFPFAYIPKVTDEAAFEKTLAVTEKIVGLRGDAPFGIVFKGFMTLDWTVSMEEALRFGPLQKGPYVLGESHTELSECDKAVRKSIWTYFYGEWTQYGKYAQRLAQLVQKLTSGNVNFCMAGLFDGGIWAPEALCSELFWNPDVNFADAVCKTYARKDVELL